MTLGMDKNEEQVIHVLHRVTFQVFHYKAPLSVTIICFQVDHDSVWPITVLTVSKFVTVATDT